MKTGFLYLCLMGIFFLTLIACQEKISSEKEVADSTESKNVPASIEKSKPVPIPDSTNYPGYDASRTEDFWINETLEAKYSKSYSIGDSIVYLKDSSDEVPRNAGYIKGTRCGEKVFFEDRYIDSEIGIEKYVYEKDLVKDPRETKFWNRRIVEGIFKTLKSSIEECACTSDFPEVTEHLLQQIKEKTTFSEENPETIKTALREYTKFYTKKH